MYRRIFNLLFVFILFLSFFFFYTQSIEAQTYSGSLDCYRANNTQRCSISGADCSSTPCPVGAGSCQTVTNEIYDRTIYCSSYTLLSCNGSSISCEGPNGSFRSVNCFNPGGSTSTPSPTGGGGSTCNGSCQTGIANCGVVGLTGGSGTCSNGGLCCQSFAPPPPPSQCPGVSQGKPTGCVGEQGGSAVGNPAGCCYGLVYDGPTGYCTCPKVSCTYNLTAPKGSLKVGESMLGTSTATFYSRNATPPIGVYQVQFNSRYGLSGLNPVTTNYSPMDLLFTKATNTGGLQRSYLSTITGLTVGHDSIRSFIRVTDSGNPPYVNTCTGYFSNGVATTGALWYDITAATPSWWQVTGGDVITNGDIRSSLPTGEKLIEKGTFTYPGNAMYGGTTNVTKANMSTTGWNANTSYQGKQYTYEYFNSIVPSSVIFNNLPTSISQTNLNGAISSDGYYWYKAAGDLTLTSDITINGSRKVILFVGGDFNINGKINIVNNGQGFFMTIVSGDINVSSAVQDTSTYPLGPNPMLEGIFETDGNFFTGGGGQNLWIRGNVTAWGNIILQRYLGSRNLTLPAETFEYAPDLTMLFPRSLVQDKVGWQEILP